MDKKKILLPLILPVILIIIWYILIDVMGVVSTNILPGPVEVCQSAYKIILSGKLLDNTLSSVFKVFFGLGLACIVGIPLGVLLGTFNNLESFSSLVLSILRPIPPIAWIPFSILWFGIGVVPAVFIIFMGCVFPILVYTLDGVKRTPKVLIEAAETLGASDKDILFKVTLPSALPVILSGVKVGVSIALMCTISAEMIGSSSGLGYMIITATNLFDTGTTVVGMLMIGLIGIIFDFIFGKLQEEVFW